MTKKRVLRKLVRLDKLLYKAKECILHAQLDLEKGEHFEILGGLFENLEDIQKTAHLIYQDEAQPIKEHNEQTNQT